MKFSKKDLETLSIIQNKGLKVICAINKITTQKSILSKFGAIKGAGVENIINISVLEETRHNRTKNKIKELFNKNT